MLLHEIEAKVKTMIILRYGNTEHSDSNGLELFDLDYCLGDDFKYLAELLSLLRAHQDVWPNDTWFNLAQKATLIKSKFDEAANQFLDRCSSFDTDPDIANRMRKCKKMVRRIDALFTAIS